MKPLNFVTAQFFLLSLSFAVIFDPIGISYFLIGLVWLFNHKLAYFEGLLIFVLKGQFGWIFANSAFLPLFSEASPFQIRIISIFLLFEISITYMLGVLLAINMSGKFVNAQIRKKAPDLLGMIQK